MPSSFDEPILALLAQARPGIRAMLARYRISAPDAEDVVQETALSLIASWASIENPWAWLFTVLRRQCWACLAYRQRYTTFEPSALIRIGGTAPPPDKAVMARVDLGRLLAYLPRRQQRILYLRHCLGMTLTEIARDNRERTKPALARDVFRARTRVRELLARIEAKKRQA